MPAVSNRTAWDFLPDEWSTTEPSQGDSDALQTYVEGCQCVVFAEADGRPRRVEFPAGFVPLTQLEKARLGIITSEMAARRRT